MTPGSPFMVFRDMIILRVFGNLKDMDLFQMLQPACVSCKCLVQALLPQLWCLYNGSLTYYRSPVLVPNIYDRWFRLNVIHDVDASDVKVYTYRWESCGWGSWTWGKILYFKCGVYLQNDKSHYMESRWKEIKVFKKE